ncbi:MAG: hypothetical protein MI748_19980, partial [Opitutales bacterium]|nr:hypothetical protein [Opitutales bacterium]
MNLRRCFYCLSVLATAICANFSHADITSDLRFHVSFDGANPLSDLSSYNHGVLEQIGATQVTGGGPDGSDCYQLDGVDDYVRWEKDYFRGGANPRTIAAWFKCEDMPNAWAGFFGYGSEANNNQNWDFKLGLYSDPSNPEYRVCIIHESGTVWSEPNAFNYGEWNHLAATYDGTEVVLYLNGVEVARDARSLNTYTWHVNIGRVKDLSTHYFKGQVDDVRHYGRALSTSDIQELYELLAPVENGTQIWISGLSPLLGLLGVLMLAGVLRSFVRGKLFSQFLLVFTLVGLLGVRDLSADIVSDLRLHIDFDHTNPLADSSIYNNHGTAHNGASLITGGGPDGSDCYSLDGVDDYISTGHSGFVSGNGARTLAAWVKLDSIPSPFNKGIFGYGPFQNDSGHEFIICATVNGEYRVSAASGPVAASPTGTIVPGEWAHVVATHDGTTMKIYVNGELEGSVQTTLDTTLSIVKAGAFNNTVMIYLDCDIDELRCYARALTAQDVRELYELVVPSDISSDLVLHADFESPDPLVDTSSSGNNGTLYGPSYVANGGYNGTGGYQLDGINDYISFGNTDVPIGASPRTVSAWFNLTSFPSGVGFGSTLFGYGSDGSPGFKDFKLAVSAAGHPALRYFGGDLVGSGSNVQNGVWNHMAASYEGTTVKLFLNGAEFATEVTTLDTYNTYVTAGRIHDASYGHFNGFLDELRIYSRALTSVEISALYASLPVNPDADSDGLLDEWELQYFGNIESQDETGDPDADGLTNLEEQEHQTDPMSVDTDGDGLTDDYEISKGLDPTEADPVAKINYLGSGIYGYQTDFEAPHGFSVGALDGQSKWNAIGASDISVEPGPDFVSSQTVQLSNVVSGTDDTNANVLISAGNYNDLWLAFDAKLVAGKPKPLPNNGDGLSAVFQINENGEVVYYDAATDSWVVTSTVVGDQTWANYICHMNYVLKQWDLYVNGNLLAYSIPFVDDSVDAMKQFVAWRFFSEESTSAHLDNFAITITRPANVVLDSDTDGLEDDLERTLGTSLLSLDTDGDGLSDGYEYINGLDPLVDEGVTDDRDTELFTVGASMFVDRTQADPILLPGVVNIPSGTELTEEDLNFTWEVMRKPTGAADPVIVDVTDPDSQITFTENGAYKLKLTLNETGYSPSDELMIFVSDQPAEDYNYLIGWWNFNEGSGNVAEDRSQWDNDGVITEASYVDGWDGKCLDFAGDDLNDKVVIPGGEDLLNGLDALTFSLWLYGDEASNTDDGFFTGYPPAGGDIHFNIRYDAHGWKSGGANTITSFLQTTKGGFRYESIPNQCIAGSWFHITIVWDNVEGYRLFKNGEDIPAAYLDNSATGGLIDTLTTFIIGQSEVSGKSWNGKIDEVRMFARSFTDEEVMDLFLDGDGDGLPDTFERAIIDADNSDAFEDFTDVKPGDDFDGDGFTNLEEHELGYSPTSKDVKLITGTLNEIKDTDWTKVELPLDFENPVVLATPQYSNTEQPAVVRLRNVEAGSFELKAESPAQDLYEIPFDDGNAWYDFDGNGDDAVGSGTTFTNT